MTSFFKANIESLTLANRHYRRVVETTPTMQLVLMSLSPGESIPAEVHSHTTQFIRVEGPDHCRGVAILNGNKTFRLEANSAIIIPPGTLHEIRNTSKTTDLKLYTIYSPPEHAPGLIKKKEF